jgi:large subunit ribosomal protein L9
MEIILRQAVENLGKPGDVVTVKNGYARNFLLPRGFAYEATPGNLKRIAQERGPPRGGRERARRLRAGAREAARGGAAHLLGARRRGGKLFGSVTSADIAEQLNAQGFHIEKRLIDLHDPIKALGVYRVPVKLHAT